MPYHQPVVKMGNMLWPFSREKDTDTMESPPAKRHHTEEQEATAVKRIDPTHETIQDEAGFVSRFSALYNNKHLSDIVIRVGPDRYFAHRFILITASDVFEAMLNQRQWSESREKEVEFTEDPNCAAVFHSFLKYLYSGSVLVSTETVLPVLLLADKYSISLLQDSCIKYMLRHIVESPDTNRTLTWYQYANMTEQTKLMEACRIFILSNFDVILDAPDWPEMTKEELKEFLSSSELIVKSEFHLWKKVEHWLTCEENRDLLEENVKEILPLLRFTMILPQNLLEVESSPLFKEYKEYFTEKINNAYRFHSLVPDCKDEKREAFRNYYSKEYKLCFPFKLENYQNICKIDSRVLIECHVPSYYLPSSRICNKLCSDFNAYFYPKGFFTTITLYGTYMNRQSDMVTMKLCKKHSENKTMKVDMTLVLYGKCNSVRYVAFSQSTSHLYRKESQTLLVDSVIDLEQLTQEESPYLIDGNLEGKIFVKIQDIGPHLLPEESK